MEDRRRGIPWRHKRWSASLFRPQMQHLRSFKGLSLGTFALYVACLLMRHGSHRHQKSLAIVPNPNQGEGTALVTFIVPSKGRVTLRATIESLTSQVDTRWEAVIVFDGIQPSVLPGDISDLFSIPRIRYYTIPKSGAANHAGTLRNYGMTKAKSAWIAFVDDDDVISPQYVSGLTEEASLNPHAETIIFRMSRLFGDEVRILPSPKAQMFGHSDVGISFAIRRTVFESGFRFAPSNVEDFDFLTKIHGARKKIIISPFVTYYVQGARPVETQMEYSRVFINY